MSDSCSRQETDPALNCSGKRRGEIAEAAFMRKALSLGFGVAKPWGDDERYDFIVTRGRFFWRVQVKSFWKLKNAYRVMTSSSRDRLYTPDLIDFLVIYLAAEELWYVIPASIGLHYALYLAPRSRRSKYLQYVEAWHLFDSCPQWFACHNSLHENAGEPPQVSR